MTPNLVNDKDFEAMSVDVDMPMVERREDLPKGPSWGFWDETWGNFYAGFKDEDDANKGLSEYLHHLMTGEPYCRGRPELYWVP